MTAMKPVWMRQKQRARPHDNRGRTLVPDRSVKAQQADADELFEAIITARDKGCQVWPCAATDYLQAAHGITRERKNVRWDERNAWLLCRGHHFQMGLHPERWVRWIVERIGQKRYDELAVLAEVRFKWDGVILIALHARARQLGLDPDEVIRLRGRKPKAPKGATA